MESSSDSSPQKSGIVIMDSTRINHWPGFNNGCYMEAPRAQMNKIPRWTAFRLCELYPEFS